MSNSKVITIQYIGGKKEVISDVLGFNFFGNAMIFDLADGRTYLVRQTYEIESYVVKGQSVIKNKKK